MSTTSCSPPMKNKWWPFHFTFSTTRLCHREKHCIYSSFKCTNTNCFPFKTSEESTKLYWHIPVEVQAYTPHSDKSVLSLSVLFTTYFHCSQTLPPLLLCNFLPPLHPTVAIQRHHAFAPLSSPYSTIPWYCIQFSSQSPISVLDMIKNDSLL